MGETKPHCEERLACNVQRNLAIANALRSGGDSWSIELGEGASDGSCEGSALILGDVGLARDVGRLIDRHGPAFPFARCPAGFFDADVICLNLECCLSDRGTPVEPKPVPLVGNASYLKAIPNPTRCVASVANNHFLDHGTDAAGDTLAALDAEGIAYIGATGSVASPQPHVAETPGGSVGFLAYTSCAHRLADTVPVNIAGGTAAEIRESVSTLRERVDVVIVVLHHGVEYCRYPHPQDRDLCRHAIMAGADLVVCHHPHVVQGIESFGRGIVFHSVGSFMMDVFERRRPEAACTYAIRARLTDGRLRQVNIEPFELSLDLQPAPMTGQAASDFGRHVHDISVVLHHDRTAQHCMRLAQRARMTARLGHATDMLRRVGVIETARYYWERVASA